MSKLMSENLRFPLNGDNVRKLKARLGTLRAEQSAVATANVVMSGAFGSMLESDKIIEEAWVQLSTALAAGESMVVDVERSTDGGTTWASILSATKTLDNTSTAKSQILLSVAPASKQQAQGTLLRAKLTYVAGGGPTGKYIVVAVEAG
jgi:hypothetical protein